MIITSCLLCDPQILSHLTNLTLILLMCRMWWAPNNARKWQVGFNSALKGLTKLHIIPSPAKKIVSPVPPCFMSTKRQL